MGVLFLNTREARELVVCPLPEYAIIILGIKPAEEEIKMIRLLRRGTVFIFVMKLANSEKLKCKIMNIKNQLSRAIN